LNTDSYAETIKIWQKKRTILVRIFPLSVQLKMHLNM